MSLNKYDSELYTKRLSVKDLKPGDTLAHDVYIKGGALVAKAGSELLESQIKKLNHLGDKAVTLDLTKVYYRGVRSSRKIMQDASEGKSIPKSTVQTMLNPFIEMFQHEKNIMKNLAQLQTRDEYTFQHTIHVGVLVFVFGEWLGIKGEELNRLALAGSLHDIGKSKVPLTVLNKPGPLTPDEWEIMKQHPLYGYEILEKSTGYEDDIKKAVLQHHERGNGSGYLSSLSGDKIHLFARILAVADFYHAMTSERVYRKKLSPFVVLELMKKNIDNLDMKITFSIIEKLVTYLQSCKIILSNGWVCDVIHIDKENLSSPLLKVQNEDTIVDLRTNKELTVQEVLTD